MIELKHVTKRYGAKCAVDDISFTINKGEVLGFLGRNGAGKSTTMNMITGYISASEGQITLDGMDVLEQPREVKRRIGYLPEQPPLYMDMTVEEYLKFVCDIKEVRKKSQKAHLDDLYNLVKITDVRHRLIKNLSKGYKQRVGLAQALVGNPDVVIMDEPTVGLDPKQIIEIRKLISGLGQNHTVVLSSHILHEVADVCDRVGILSHGKVLVERGLSELQENLVKMQVVFQEKELPQLPTDLEVLHVSHVGRIHTLIVRGNATDVTNRLAVYAPILLEALPLTLEEIFIYELGGEDYEVRDIVL